MNRFLVLSGGGAAGAYEVGAISYLVNVLGRSYSSFYGISAGALNASVMASYASDVEASNELIALWYNLSRKNIYKNWSFGYLSLLWRNSLYDTSPLIKLLEGSVSREMMLSAGKKLTVSAVDLASGDPMSFTQIHPDIVKAVAASSAMPVYFPPQSINGNMYVDGGVSDMSNLETAIDDVYQECEIDLVLTYPEEFTVLSKKHYTFLDIFSRFIDLTLSKIGQDDMTISNLMLKLNRNVKVNVIRPSNKLPIDVLQFEHSQIIKVSDMGFQDAKRCVIK
jgi:predicted patatin/cPLA2 family phospholipase